MNTKKLYVTITIIILFAYGLQYLSGMGTLYPSGSYNFQSILAQRTLANHSFNLATYNNVYINNAKNVAAAPDINLVFLTVSAVTQYGPMMLSYILLGVSIISIILFFRELFYSWAIGIVAAILFLSNPTFLIVKSYIVYYYLSLFLLVKYIRSKSVFILILILPLLVASYFTHTSSFFAIFSILVITGTCYVILSSFSNRKVNRRMVLSILVLISFIILVTLSFTQTSKYLNDFVRNFPEVINRILFYVSSYNKDMYFYTYVIGKIILISLASLFILKRARLMWAKDKTLTKNDAVIVSYSLSLIPLSILFGFTNVFARTFDYFLPLLGALAFYEIQLLGNKRMREILIILMLSAFLLISSINFIIPPRSLEKYDPATISGLNFAIQTNNVFTDTFLANALISYLQYYRVSGLEYGNLAKINAIYYDKNESVIYNEFEGKNVDYLIISAHSLTRGLDILNAPHFLKPITEVSRYDSMRFLDKIYSNKNIWIWKFNEL